MLWFILSLISAVFQSAFEISSKKNLKNLDEYMISFSMAFFALPFTIPFLVYEKFLILNDDFWIALIVSGSLNVIILILFMKSIKDSPLSLTIPMFAFTPVFLLLTSPIILNEIPSTLGISGAILVTAGTYLLNFDQKEKGIFLPFKKIVQRRGPAYMLIGAFLLSIATNFDKIGVLNSSSIIWVVSIDIFLSFSFGIILIIRKKNFNQISTNIKPLFLIGLFTAITQISLMISYTMTIVPYALAVKRMSIMFTSIFGFFVFKEDNIKQKIFAIGIMLVGVVMILFA